MAPKLYGLVLAGGRSTRMGRDKAALNYHGEEESRRVFHLLETVCDAVFLSCRADQADAPGRRGLAQVHDSVEGTGPLVGILSAFHAHPDAAWLVVACDLPHLDVALLNDLLTQRDTAKVATAFQGFEDFPEPLCAVYEPAALERLELFRSKGYDCPRKMLINSDIALLPPVGERLANANTPEDAARLGSLS